MLMPTDAAAKLKEEGGARQVGRFNLRDDRIGFNSACCRVIVESFALFLVFASRIITLKF
jgi:hypothetical protein